MSKIQTSGLQVSKGSKSPVRPSPQISKCTDAQTDLDTISFELPMTSTESTVMTILGIIALQ